MPKGKRKRNKPKNGKMKMIDLEEAVRSFNLFMHGEVSPTHVFGHGYVDKTNRYERARYLE